jgi:hypothetical protein
VISSVAKPLQNDYDTIIIDLLTRYGLDNKNVQRFVQTVAQQTKVLRRIPKLLNPAKQSSSSKAPVPETDTQEGVSTKDEKRKPGFFARLENVQNTYNKRGLLGVFFDYLKNRQTDTPAKEVSTNSLKNKQKDKPTSNLIRETKVKEEKTNLIERSLEKLEKYQEIFGKRGAIGVVQNIYKDLKSSRNNPLTQNATKITNNAQNINNNTVNRATTIGPKSLLPKVKGTEQELPLTDTEGQQSQKQNIFRKFTVVLGGIDEQGKKDFKGIFEMVLQDFTTKQQKQISRSQQPLPNEGYESAGGEGGLLDLITDIAMLRMMGGARGGAPKPGGRKWNKPSTWFKRGGAPAPGGAKPGRLPGRFGGLSRLLGLFGLGAAAAGTAAQVLPATPPPLPTATTPPVAPSAPATSVVPKPITPVPTPTTLPPKAPPIPTTLPPKPGLLSKAAGGALAGAGGLLKRLPLISTAIEGGTNIYDSFKELAPREDLTATQKISTGGGALAGGAVDVLSGLFDPTTWGIDKMLGVDLFGEGLSREFLNLVGAKDKGSTMGETLRTRTGDMFTTLNGVLENNLELSKKTNNNEFDLVDLLQYIPKAVQLTPGLGPAALTAAAFTHTPEQKNPLGDITTKTATDLAIAAAGGKPEIQKSKPESKPPVKIPKQTTPEKKEFTPLPKPGLSKPPDTIAAAVKPQNQVVPPSTITPKTTEILPSTPPSLTENHVTNNNADKQILSDIAGNTEKTNQNLGTLSQAIYALAKTFDTKGNNGSNNILINSGQGVKQYTSTSQMANSNNDTIRSIRRQFLTAIG